MRPNYLILFLGSAVFLSAHSQSVDIDLNFSKAFAKRKELALSISENGIAMKTERFSYMEFTLSANVGNTYSLFLLEKADTLMRFNIDTRGLEEVAEVAEKSYDIRFAPSDIQAIDAVTWVFDPQKAGFVKATAAPNRTQRKAKLEAEMQALEAAEKAEEKRRAEIEELEIERRQQEADARRAKEQQLAEELRKEKELKRKEEEAKAEANRKRLAASEAAFEAERKRKAQAAFEAEQKAIAQAKAVSEAQKRERAEAVAKMEEERKSLAVKNAGAVIARTEQQFTENNSNVRQITIEREFMTYVYKQVVYNWGGTYYFRDDDSITKAVFELETEK